MGAMARYEVFRASKLSFANQFCAVSGRTNTLAQWRCEMVLRKCPACKDMVGAESPECPRCGVNFRGFLIKRYAMWLTTLAILALAAVKWL